MTQFVLDVAEERLFDFLRAHAVEVDGKIIVLYDPVVHQTVDRDDPELDPRWVSCKRPFIMVGGERATFERLRVVLQALGDARYIGPVGSAARLKLVANSMLGIISAAAGELYNAGLRAGLDRERVWEVLTRLAPYLDARRAGYLEGRYDPVMFRLADMVKDLDLALEVYQEVGIDTPLSRTTRELFERAARDHGEEDLAAIAELWRQPVAGAPADR